jgi:hypothetical protein
LDHVQVNTITVSAAVSAIVTVIVGTALNWGARVVSYFRRRVPPDHIPLSSGSGWLASGAVSATEQIRLLVCCAPNRSLRQREINPDRAVLFVRKQFPGLFPDEPVFSMPGTGVRFETAGGGPQNEYAWVHASGRIDLCVNVRTTPIDPGPVTAGVEDLMRPLLQVLQAMRSADYDRTFGSRLPGLPRRFDWAYAVSPTIVIQNRGRASWQDLIFPGTRPPRAGTEQQAFCPPTGYAARALRNWPMSRPASRLVRTTLEDMLRQNGYHNIDQSVTDVINALDADRRERAGEERDWLDGR